MLTEYVLFLSKYYMDIRFPFNQSISPPNGASKTYLSSKTDELSK